jgi:C-terminal processing protease CtpA/Prc
VSQESNAEKLGIRKGDIIERLNGEHISTTTEVDFFDHTTEVDSTPSVSKYKMF